MKQINTIETLKEAMEKSSSFSSLVNDRLYNDLMFEQEMLSRDYDLAGVRCHDHYTSFFYTITDRRAFLESVAGCGMCEAETAAALLEKENKLYEMEEENKNYDLLDAWLDKKAADLLEEIENNLHFYENPDREYIDEMLKNYIYDNVFENYFLDGDKVRELIPARAARYAVI